MSCYLRHLKDVLNEAGVEVRAGNKKQIDQAIHQMVGVSYKNCPSAWKKIKEQLGDEQRRQAFLEQLQHAIE